VERINRLLDKVGPQVKNGLLNQVKVTDEYILLENESFKLIYSLSKLDAKNIEDIKYLSTITGINYKKLTDNKQVHSSLVRVIDREQVGENAEADSILTNLKGGGLIVYTADCVPVVMIDPKTKSIANVHAGWRGTYGSIVEKSLEMMKKSYGASMEDVYVYIGPYIGISAFEVGDDLYKKFETFIKSKLADEEFSKKWPYCYDIVNSRYHLDLGKINELLAVEMGIKAENIYNLNLCTVENSEILHSYRAHDKIEKRIGTIVYIKDE